MKLIKLIGLSLLVLHMFNCTADRTDKEQQDRNVQGIVLLSVIGTGGSCSIGVNRGGRESTASANPVVLTTSSQSVAYSKVPVVPHSIGLVTFLNAAQGNKVEFSTVDVGDFDGEGTASQPLVYESGDCPVFSSKQITTNMATYYTRTVSGTTYTYEINRAGNYSFVLYQLQYPAIPSTVRGIF
jgi:hypothetical protein